jgi:2,3-bisphosphoglycerate-independent phosphoglycerate mutase
VAYEKDNLENTIGEVLATHGKTQLRMAETEKYPHVTFFFSGGREAVFNGETRIVIPSPQVATYDLKPEMSANLLCAEALVQMGKSDAPDFVCINFANADMVGHTGVFTAVVKALETVDNCLKQIVELGIKNNYSFIIIADHGNADFMLNNDGSPNTAHSMNPVPAILIDDEFKHIKNGRLADVSPSILQLLNIPQAPEMLGKSLIY